MGNRSRTASATSHRPVDRSPKGGKSNEAYNQRIPPGEPSDQRVVDLQETQKEQEYDDDHQENNLLRVLTEIRQGQATTSCASIIHVMPF
jgi:hypothetical protein